MNLQTDVIEPFCNRLMLSGSNTIVVFMTKGSVTTSCAVIGSFLFAKKTHPVMKGGMHCKYVRKLGSANFI